MPETVALGPTPIPWPWPPALACGAASSGRSRSVSSYSPLRVRAGRGGLVPAASIERRVSLPDYQYPLPAAWADPGRCLTRWVGAFGLCPPDPQADVAPVATRTPGSEVLAPGEVGTSQVAPSLGRD